MGSLDIISAKQQFFQLVDAVGSKYLPTFTIWLDTKLAEYKVNGVLKPDEDALSTQQYPEWISKSLRQNLSFVFAGEPEEDKSKTEATKRTDTVQRTPDRLSDRPNKPPRPKLPANQSEPMQSSVAIKQEDGSDDDDLVLMSFPDSSPPPKRQRFSGIDNASLHQSSSAQHVREVETPMPFVENTFSLQVSQCEDDNSSGSQQMGTFGSSLMDTFASGDQSLFQQSASLSSPSASNISQSFTPGGSSVKQDIPEGESSQTPGKMGPPVQPASAEMLPVSVRVPLGQDSGLDSEKGGSISSKLRFQCSKCPRSFMFNCDLIRHLRVHTGVKPFSCPYCPKSFTVVSGCYAHMRRSHKGSPVVVVKPRFDSSSIDAVPRKF